MTERLPRKKLFDPWQGWWVTLTTGECSMSYCSTCMLHACSLTIKGKPSAVQTTALRMIEVQSLWQSGSMWATFGPTSRVLYKQLLLSYAVIYTHPCDWPPLQKKFHDILLRCFYSPHERCSSVAGLGVNVGPGIQQESHQSLLGTHIIIPDFYTVKLI